MNDQSLSTLVDSQQQIIQETQRAILHTMRPGVPIDDNSVSDVLRLSQALAVQVDKLATLKGLG